MLADVQSVMEIVKSIVKVHSVLYSIYVATH